MIMTEFLFFGKRNIYWIRLCSFFLAVLFCLGAAVFPLYAAETSFFTANSDSDTQPGITGTPSETTDTNQIPVMDTTAQASLIVGTGRGMFLYRNRDDVSANYPAASKLM